MNTPPSSIEIDSREVPLHSLPDASIYLGIKGSTLRTWTRGRYYPTKQGRRFFPPLIELADGDRALFSFANLAEAHVLQATRDKNIPVPAVRRAIDYLKIHWPSRHPLISRDFRRFGRQLFVKIIEENMHVNITQSGQIGLKRILDQCLERLERDSTGYPVRIFPLNTKHIVLDVHVAAGQPVIKNTRLLASVLWGRNKAGDSIQDLARAYRLKQADVKEAVAYFRAA